METDMGIYFCNLLNKVWNVHIVSTLELHKIRHNGNGSGTLSYKFHHRLVKGKVRLPCR